MRKKLKPAPPSNPEWLTIYADMMSLLLTFFILLVSLSEIKDENRYKAVAQNVQQAFGMEGGGGRLPTNEDPELSFQQLKEALANQNQPEPNDSVSAEEGFDGPHHRVTRVREGLAFVQGGRVIFDPGSADLTIKAMRQLRVVAPQLRGTNNVIEVRGHAASLELAGGSTKFTDLENLSYMRAKAVMTYLTTAEGMDLDPSRFRLIAAADHEPMNKRDYNLQEQEPNRRVELFENEALIQDLMRPEAD